MYTAIENLRFMGWRYCICREIPFFLNITMKKILLLALGCLVFNVLAFSQKPYYVVSDNGLKLRETPGKTGRVLAVAPFGAEVQVMVAPDTGDDEMQFDPPARRDSVGMLFSSRFSDHATPHMGYWWPVQYSGKSGFMFSGFLADSDMVQSGYPELNDQFRLRAIGGNASASNNPEFDPGWYWYGLFRENGGRFNLKKVTPRYAVADYTDSTGGYELIARELIIRTDPPQRPAWIIGSRKPWKEQHTIQGVDLEEAPQAQYSDDLGTLNLAFLKKYALEVERQTIDREGYFEENIQTWFMTGKNGLRQRVEPLSIEYSYTMYLYPNALAWAGDLDGDGKLDYIFRADGEIGYYVLYLTTLAGKGEIARPAAVLWQWYGC